MDIKIAGITEEIMKVALGQAKDGRIHILGEMAKALTGARAELGEYAPRIETIKIPTDKIREVIGTGGKVIREIVEKTGAKVNIEDDGTVKVASADGAIDQGRRSTGSSRSPPMPEVGQIYDGTVVKVMEFGAFVNFFGAKDGLVHISQLADEPRARRPPTSSRKATRSRSSCSASTIAARSGCRCASSTRRPARTSKRAPAPRRPRPPSSKMRTLTLNRCAALDAPHTGASTPQKWPISRRNGLLRTRKGRVRYGICAKSNGLNIMQVSFAAALDDGRRTIAIGRISRKRALASRRARARRPTVRRPS